MTTDQLKKRRARIGALIMKLLRETTRIDMLLIYRR